MKIFILSIATFSSLIFADTNTKYRSSHYKMIGIFEKGAVQQQLIDAPSAELLEQKIKEAWASGHKVVDIKYAFSRCIAPVQKEKSGSQLLLRTDCFRDSDDEILLIWKKGYRLRNFEHGLATWLMLFEKEGKSIEQAIERRKTYEKIKRVIARYWQQGFKIADVEYGLGRYTVLFEKSAKILPRSISYRSRWSQLQRAIKRYRVKGYDVVNIEFMLGRWPAIFSKRAELANQGYSVTYGFGEFKKKFAKKLKQATDASILQRVGKAKVRMYRC